MAKIFAQLAMADFPLSCSVEDARHSLELAKSMHQRAHAMWQNARKTLDATEAMHKGLHTRIEELAARGAFRREFTTTLLSGILDATIQATGADMGNIQLLNPQNGHLRIHVQRGFERPFLEFFNSVYADEAACGTALKKMQRVIVPDVADSLLLTHSDCVEILLDAGVRAVQFTPIVGKSGRIWGMLSTHYRKVNQPNHKDLQLIDYCANWAAALLDANHRAAYLNGRPSAHNGNGPDIPAAAAPCVR